jgi:hypothetical protein
VPRAPPPLPQDDPEGHEADPREHREHRERVEPGLRGERHHRHARDADERGQQLPRGRAGAQHQPGEAGDHDRLHRADRCGDTARRSVRVRLTPRASERIDGFFADHLANEARLFAGLTADERGQLAAVLRTALLALGDTDIS